jgi:tetratricopeptide (TPR) repeat protein
MRRVAPSFTPVLLCALLLLPVAVRSAPQEPAPVVETQRVTAFDLLVELRRPRKPEKSVAAPADLALEDLTVLWDGTSLPLVDLASGPQDREPWRLVVYIDRLLASNHTIRWAAMELAERARRLTELGEVEIVVAEPEPRRALAPTRDRKLLDDSLSGVFLAPAGTSDLVARREQFLLATSAESPDEARVERALHAAGVERRLLRRQTDRLLDWLIDSEPPTSRRVVLLVGDGWDLHPEAFYAGSDAASPPAAQLSVVAQQARNLAENLTAYGWIVAPLAPPAPPVGVGRFGVFVLPDVTFPWLFAFKLRSLEVWLDGNRKPKMADALTELAHSLRDQGRLERAVETYKKAVYHYYDHPKTASRQAAALVALGETLDLQGEADEARAAFRTATAFDPTLVSRFPFAAAKLLAPHEPLEQLAGLTTGNVVADPDALDRLLSSLAQRLRVTAQLPGDPDNALHHLELRLRRPAFDHRSPAIARWGTPPAIAELRLRRLLDGDLTLGDLELTAALAGGPETHDGRLEVDLQLPSESDHPRRADLLVSWASAGPETAIRYRTRGAKMSAAGTTTLPIDLPADHLWLALLVEDPVGGVWGGSAIELSDG